MNVRLDRLLGSIYTLLIVAHSLRANVPVDSLCDGFLPQFEPESFSNSLIFLILDSAVLDRLMLTQTRRVACHMPPSNVIIIGGSNGPMLFSSALLPDYQELFGGFQEVSQQLPPCETLKQALDAILPIMQMFTDYYVVKHLVYVAPRSTSCLNLTAELQACVPILASNVSTRMPSVVASGICAFSDAQNTCNPGNLTTFVSDQRALFGVVLANVFQMVSCLADLTRQFREWFAVLQQDPALIRLDEHMFRDIIIPDESGLELFAEVISRVLLIIILPIVIVFISCCICSFMICTAGVIQHANEAVFVA